MGGMMIGTLFVEDSILMKTAPQLKPIIEAVLEKSKDFENYRKFILDDPEVPMTVCHNDLHHL